MSYTFTPTTFNPAAKGAAAALSGGNLVVDFDATTSAHVRAVDPILPGKFFMSATLLAGGGGLYPLIFGLCNTSLPLNSASVYNANVKLAVTFLDNGIYFAGTPIAYHAVSSFSVGDVIGLQIDTKAHTVQVFVNGAPSGAPVTNAAIVPGLYPFIGFDNTSSFPLTARANFGASSFLVPDLEGTIMGVGTLSYTVEYDSPDRFVYRSTDLGAPTVAIAAGGFLAVLKACLVDGYGDKPPAGWTMPFSSGSTIAVFQQGAGGNGRFFRVYDNAVSTNAADRVINIRGYESMSGVSAGTNPFPTTGQVGGNGPACGYSGVAEAFQAGWVVVASPSHVWVVCDVYPGGNRAVAGFGTFPSNLPVDGYNNFVCANPTADDGRGASLQYFELQAASAPNLWVERSDTAAVGALVAELAPTAPIRVSLYDWVGSSSGRRAFPERGTNALLQFQPEVIADGLSRGHLPGLWDTCHDPASIGPHGTRWAGDAAGTLAGRRFELIRGLLGSSATLALEISGGAD